MLMWEYLYDVKQTINDIIAGNGIISVIKFLLSYQKQLEDYMIVAIFGRKFLDSGAKWPEFISKQVLLSMF